MTGLLSNVGKYVVIRQDNQGIVIATRKRSMQMTTAQELREIVKNG